MTETMVQNPYAKFDEQADGSVPTATLAIYDGIAERLSRGKDVNVNRASAATMCVRRRWYQANGFEGTPLTPRKIVNFMMGDLAEKVLLHFLRESLVGPGKLYSEVNLGDEVGSFQFNGREIKVYEQKTLGWRISDDLIITAHLDGLGKRNLDGKWELIECKSAAEYGFDSFKESGPGDYLKQGHACMMTEELRALDVREIRYFYLLKTTGHIYDRVFSFDKTTADIVESEYVAAQWKAAPAQPHGFKDETNRGKPTGRRVLGFPCSYCPYVSQCHPTAQMEFKSGAFGVQKPVFVERKVS